MYSIVFNCFLNDSSQRQFAILSEIYEGDSSKINQIGPLGGKQVVKKIVKVSYLYGNIEIVLHYKRNERC